MNIYVDKNVPIDGNGQKTHPFKTIQAAANIAQPGDTVLVAPGIYRENVNPKIVELQVNELRISHQKTWVL